MSFIEKFFHLKENQTTLQADVMGCLAIFMIMSYIIFVNPAILAKAGLPFEATVTATAWSSGIATLIMVHYSNYPFAMVCGMGLSAVLAYNVVLGMNVSCQTGMRVIVIEGILVTLLVLAILREIFSPKPVAVLIDVTLPQTKIDSYWNIF